MTKDLASTISTLEQCHLDLFNIFNDLEITRAFRINLERLHQFYFRYCTENNTTTKRVNEYQALINTIKEVKMGRKSAEEALNNRHQLSSQRKTDIILDNVLKTCELIFWATAAITAYAFCLGIAIPMMFFNPILGAACTIGASILMLESSILAFKCIDEFKSFNKANTLEKYECDTLSFFSKSEAYHPKPTESEPITHAEACLPCL